MDGVPDKLCDWLPNVFDGLQGSAHRGFDLSPRFWPETVWVLSRSNDTVPMSLHNTVVSFRTAGNSHTSSRRRCSSWQLGVIVHGYGAWLGDKLLPFITLEALIVIPRRRRHTCN